MMRPSHAFKGGVDRLRREKHTPRPDEYGMTSFSAHVVLRSWKSGPQTHQDIVGDAERAAPLLEPPT
ncbi:hypothetical protein MPC4_340021 [Methylocella tundrae]|uniref:Uncharacterized protein n=1 Tax=Methylocella tundrae TaxID=227605 RepID=A0A8B6M9T3_METTU|nr:hypothetical protein MPC1_3050001 [Methylocella tundrae]VTZ51265.1 hypothetical protein MPC4_340021 [Methylocella tundrae]